MAVHLLADQVMRQLVDGSRGEAVARFQQAEEVVAMGHQAVVVHARIALVDRHRIVAMALADLAEAAGHQREGLVPADRLPLAADPAQRLAQAVGVVLMSCRATALGQTWPRLKLSCGSPLIERIRGTPPSSLSVSMASPQMASQRWHAR